MKKLMLLFSMLFVFIQFYGQNVNHKPVADIKSEYIEVIGISNWIGTKVKIVVDYGQKKRFWLWDVFYNKRLIRNQNNKKIKFNTMIDGLNFFEKNNYKFINGYVIADEYNTNKKRYHYLLKRIEN
jgi:hypothetical protein